MLKLIKNYRHYRFLDLICAGSLAFTLLAFPKSWAADAEETGSLSYAGTGEKAINTEVFAKRIACCGSYFTSVDGEYKIVYKNIQIPWGARVYFYYGFSAVPRSSTVVLEKEKFNWQRGGELEMTAQAPYIWEGVFRQQLANRSNSMRLAELQFVFKIVDENGNISWERSNSSEMGHYQGADITFMPSACSEAADLENSQCLLPLTSVFKVK